MCVSLCSPRPFALSSILIPSPPLSHLSGTASAGFVSQAPMIAGFWPSQASGGIESRMEYKGREKPLLLTGLLLKQLHLLHGSSFL